eukprot:SAG11_NODE_1951_length_4011_cov_5.799080_2_plen_313_part_00
MTYLDDFRDRAQIRALGFGGLRAAVGRCGAARLADVRQSAARLVRDRALRPDARPAAKARRRGFTPLFRELYLPSITPHSCDPARFCVRGRGRQQCVRVLFSAVLSSTRNRRRSNLNPPTLNLATNDGQVDCSYCQPGASRWPASGNWRHKETFELALSLGHDRGGEFAHIYDFQHFYCTPVRPAVAAALPFSAARMIGALFWVDLPCGSCLPHTSFHTTQPDAEGMWEDAGGQGGVEAGDADDSLDTRSAGVRASQAARRAYRWLRMTHSKLLIDLQLSCYTDMRSRIEYSCLAICVSFAHIHFGVARWGQ